MRCDEGCGDCCNVVIVTREEFDTVKHYAKQKGIKPVRQGKCPWYQDGKCSVYPARPKICRLFGHSDVQGLVCSRGYNVNTSVEDEERWLRGNDRANILLHEIFSDGKELAKEGLPERFRDKEMKIGLPEYER